MGFPGTPPTQGGLLPDGKRHCAIVLTTDNDLQRSGCFRRFGGLLLRKGLTVRVFLSFLTTHAFATVWAFYIVCFFHYVISFYDLSLP